LIFYEAPHKLLNTLSDFLKYFGDRKISLCRELTKVYEEVLRMTLSEAIAYYETKAPKGEYVLVIEGAEEHNELENLTLEQAADMVKALVEEGVKPSEACKKIAKDTEFSKSVLYSAIVNKEE
jgi:16S rRNA (cytidine1402-2'-O)-methyltransferase